MHVKSLHGVQRSASLGSAESWVAAADASSLCITLPALTKFARLCWLMDLWLYAGAGRGRLQRLDHQLMIYRRPWAEPCQSRDTVTGSRRMLYLQLQCRLLLSAYQNFIQAESVDEERSEK